MAINIWLDRVRPAPTGFRGFTSVEEVAAFVGALRRHPSRPRAQRIDVSAELAAELFESTPAFPRVLRVHGQLSKDAAETLRERAPSDCWLVAA